MPRGVARLLALLAVAAVLPTLLLGAPTAPAAADTQPIEVLIESVTPALPTRADDLTIGGRIANTSDTEIALPQVQLRLSPLQLNSRGEITQVLDGTTDRTGLAIPDTLTSLGPTLAPGQQAQFQLSVPVKDLALAPELAGVFAIFVEALSGDVPVVEAGTVFPWFPQGAKLRPTRLAWVWPITQRPAMAADELVTDPALPAEFTPDGRLGRLIDAGQRYPVAWLLDTATWQTAAAMADGYRVAGPGGPQPGDQTTAAEQFAARMRTIMASGAATVSQFAMADADALQRGGLTQYVVRSASLPKVLSEQIASGTPPDELFDAPNGSIDPAALETLVDAGMREVLLGDRFFPPDPPLAYTPSGVTPISVAGNDVTGLLGDQILNRVLQLPLDTAAQRSRAKQEFLTQTALITLELPTDPRRVVVAPPPLWDPPKDWLDNLLRVVTKASWVRLASLADVAAATPVPRAATGYDQDSERGELPPDYIARIGALDEELDRLSRVAVDPAGFGESFSVALQRAASALWRFDEDGRNAFLDTIDRQIQEQKRKVRVVSSGTVTLAGDSGVVPLTIANDLDRPVSVGIELATTNPITLQYTPIDPVRIDAQEKAGVEVPVRVVGSQPMTVNVVLTDRDGRVYDDSATLELRSTASSRIATLVAVVGGVALVILVALNLFRRHRNSLATPASDELAETLSDEDAEADEAEAEEDDAEAPAEDLDGDAEEGDPHDGGHRV